MKPHSILIAFFVVLFGWVCSEAQRDSVKPVSQSSLRWSETTISISHTDTLIDVPPMAADFVLEITGDSAYLSKWMEIQYDQDARFWLMYNSKDHVYRTTLKKIIGPVLNQSKDTLGILLGIPNGIRGPNADVDSLVKMFENSVIAYRGGETNAGTTFFVRGNNYKYYVDAIPGASKAAKLWQSR